MFRSHIRLVYVHFVSGDVPDGLAIPVSGCSPSTPRRMIGAVVSGAVGLVVPGTAVRLGRTCGPRNFFTVPLIAPLVGGTPCSQL